jgi:DNA-binding MarR family transcriptional regulator
MTAKSKATAPPAEVAPAKRPKLTSVSPPGREEEATFDRLVYERVRLGIMSALAVREELTFSELKELFDVSDGNLSAHARKLEEAKYLTCTKSFAERRPKSVYRLTPRGRAALNRYLDHVEAVIKATRGT